MLTLLAVFLLGSILMPVLVRWLGSQAFAIAALIPTAAFIHALVLTPRCSTARRPSSRSRGFRSSG